MDRLNRFPQGAPPSELLNKILAMLFSEEEAGLVSRAILVDMECNDQTYYVLPPPMAGFFEFSMMRVKRDLI